MNLEQPVQYYVGLLVCMQVPLFYFFVTDINLNKVYVLIIIRSIGFNHERKGCGNSEVTFELI